MLSLFYPTIKLCGIIFPLEDTLLLDHAVRGSIIPLLQHFYNKSNEQAVRRQDGCEAREATILP